MVMIGTCGALDPGLATGDVVVLAMWLYFRKRWPEKGLLTRTRL